MKARGEAGVVANKIPHTVPSKLLDYVRPGRKNTAAAHAEATAATETTAQVPLPAEVVRGTVESVRDFAGPMDYPSIQNWLRDCEDHLERGRDGHTYSSMTLTFAVNGCTQIDDIVYMSTAEIKAMAVEGDLDVTIGLVNRVHGYALEDVDRIKRTSRA